MNEELQTQLATELAGNTSLYNDVVTLFAQTNEQINTITVESTQKDDEIAKLRQSNAEYVSQIGNLITKIPITTSSNSVQTLSQRLEAVKTTQWTDKK